MGSGRALTLFNGTQFFFEVDIERGGSHLFLFEIKYWRNARWAEMTDQGDFVVLKVLKPCIKSLGWRKRE